MFFGPPLIFRQPQGSNLFSFSTDYRKASLAQLGKLKIFHGRLRQWGDLLIEAQRINVKDA